MSQTYKNIIFTNHAFDRIKNRSISKHAVYETINHSDKKQSKSESATKYIKTIKDRKYHVVAKYQADQRKYLVISTWVRGEDDQLPLIWQLITLPFKLAWELLKLQLWIFKFLWKILKKLW